MKFGISIKNCIKQYGFYVEKSFHQNSTEVEYRRSYTRKELRGVGIEFFGKSFSDGIHVV